MEQLWREWKQIRKFVYKKYRQMYHLFSYKRENKMEIEQKIDTIVAFFFNLQFDPTINPV